MANAETAQRGYLLTKDPAFLAPYHAAVRGELATELTNLKLLLADSQSQEARLSRLSVLIDQKSDELASSLNLARESRHESIETPVSARAGKDQMDAIRLLIREIELNEQALVGARSREVHKDEREIVRVAIATSVVSSLLRVIIALWRRSRMAERVLKANG